MSSDVPSACNNNIVAESDLGAALDALRDYFDQRIAATKQDENSNDKQEKEQGSVLVVQQQLVRDCAQSLSKRLAEVVQPVSDDAFHAYLARYKDDLMLLGITSPPGEQDANDPTTTNNTTPLNDDDNLLPQPEEEELMDQEALKRVREMRQQVRTHAAAIQARRAATLDRSVAVAERQLKLLCLKTTTTETNNQQQENINIPLENYKVQMHDMQASLESMQTVLQEMGTAVPSKLLKFQSMLQEIEQALHQQQSQPLSQIEQAIYLRHRAENDNGQDTAELEQLEPAQRLANLLCRD